MRISLMVVLLFILGGLFAPQAEASSWRAGSRVSCNWLGLGTYYNGTVAARMGSQLSIKYDDGDEEVTSSSRCRLVSGPTNGRTTGSIGSFSVGSRVSCNWQAGGVYYSGTLDVMVGSQMRVLYDDGDEELTSASYCRAL